MTDLSYGIPLEVGDFVSHSPGGTDRIFIVDEITNKVLVRLVDNTRGTWHPQLSYTAVYKITVDEVLKKHNWSVLPDWINKIPGCLVEFEDVSSGVG